MSPAGWFCCTRPLATKVSLAVQKPGSGEWHEVVIPNSVRALVLMNLQVSTGLHGWAGGWVGWHIIILIFCCRRNHLDSPPQRSHHHAPITHTCNRGSLSARCISSVMHALLLQNSLRRLLTRPQDQATTVAWVCDVAQVARHIATCWPDEDCRRVNAVIVAWFRGNRDP